MGINRRTFLLAAGLGAAGAALAGCTTKGAPPPPVTGTSPVTPPPPVSTSAAVVPMDYQNLAGRLAGQLALPGGTGYDTAKLAYNPLYDGRKPAAVALCANPSDVQRCVSAAVASKTPFAARSGGHSYAGYSTPDGALIIDVSKLNQVGPNPDGTVTVGAGTRLIDVYAGLAGAGRAVPGGSCPSVGIAGLTLGGGIGVLARKYGLTCDNLASATVVTADGSSRTVNASQNADLFWGLRGGGGGNFGVVTSFTFKTADAPQCTVFSLSFPAGSAADVLGGWQQWVAAAPDELWSTVQIPGSSSSPATTVGGCYVGAESGLGPLLADLVGKIGTQPRSRSMSTRGYLDAMRYFAGCSSKGVNECHLESAGGSLGRETFLGSSRVITGQTDPAKVVAACAGHTGLTLIVDSLGGAVGRVAPDATAFPHRTALATAQIYFSTTASTVAATTQSMAQVRDALGAVLGTGGYVNYIDPAMPDWGQAYYGANLAKLKQVAATYDPSGAFTFPQAVVKA